MSSEEIYNQLLPIIATYLPEDVSVNSINQDSDLTKDLNINSAYLVDVVLDVEDTYNVEFTNQDMEKLRTVNDAIEIIQNKISNKE
jgi:acyl carrier protein